MLSAPNNNNYLFLDYLRLWPAKGIVIVTSNTDMIEFVSYFSKEVIVQHQLSHSFETGAGKFIPQSLFFVVYNANQIGFSELLFGILEVENKSCNMIYKYGVTKFSDFDFSRPRGIEISEETPIRFFVHINRYLAEIQIDKICHENCSNDCTQSFDDSACLGNPKCSAGAVEDSQGRCKNRRVTTREDMTLIWRLFNLTQCEAGTQRE